MRKKIIVLLFFALMSGILQAQVPTDNLVGYWPFNGNADDESENDNHGSVNGAVLTTDRFGNQESAYYFDGLTNYIEIPLSTPLETSDITISAWIKTNTIGNLEDGDWMDIVSYGEGAHVVAIDENGYVLGGIQGSDENCEFSGNVIASTNEWTFITMTRNNNHVILYLNGEEHFMDSCYYSVVFNHDYLNFGRDPSWDEEYFEGIIDDIRIYDRALDITEIQELYSMNTGVVLSNSTNTMKWYPNPANNYLIINTGDYFQKTGYNLEILNSLGQIVLTNVISQEEIQLNVNDLGVHGIYIIKIKDDQGTVIESGKLISK